MMSRLELRAYRSRVHLGCSQEERAIAQEVEFDVLVQFHKEPGGARTDQLKDTLCYDVLCQGIEQTCRSHPFQLIEALGRETYESLRRAIAAECLVDLQVTVHKLKTPIAGLLGGARFTYGDPLR